MNEELNKQRDEMDGGFAVVDRERLIEEETREVTPWYKHFIHVFTSPEKMMEECFTQDPPKGTSVVVVGAMLFTIIATLIAFYNPMIKIKVMDALRASKVAEDKIDQMYSMSLIGGVVGAIVGVFLSCLFTAVILQIIKAIMRDKAKFGSLYKVALLAIMVSSAISCVDAILAYYIGIAGSVFSIQFLLSEVQQSTAFGTVLATSFTLENIISLILIAIGYKVVTHTSYKKGIIAVVITEIVSIALQYGYTSLTLSMQSQLIH